MLRKFLYLLRDYGLPVGPDQYLELLRGLRRGMAEDLDALYLFARLCFVKRVEHNDAYHRAFALFFYGVDLPAVALDDPNLVYTKQFRDWLREAIERGEIQPVTQNLSREELMRRFEATLREQMEAHNGGNKWIGTGGTSPFGHSGAAMDNGVRVFGDSRNRAASKVIGDRRYVEYSADQYLAGGNIRQALAVLKHMKPHGAPTELDIPETIYRTARAGGEIELEFRPELRDRIQVVLLLDNGGTSMSPFVDVTRELFYRVRDRFRECKTFFFHNCPYDILFTDSQRTRGVPTERFLKEQHPDTRLIIVGDASMAPDELYAAYGSINYGEESAEPGIYWLRALRERFAHSVWLNPLPRNGWENGRGPWTLRQIREVFPMEDMTLAGIKRAVEILSRPTR
ncbi:MAG: hypothetical protein RIF32_03225 [Leptospirales bacterium]